MSHHELSVTRAPHLPALTGIRALAAWLVVLYHMRQSLTGWMPSAITPVLNKGYLAVDLFFLLSGFVLWLSYADKLSGGGTQQINTFLWRRFTRIWPLHAVILCGFMLFYAAMELSGRTMRGFPWAEIPLHILLVQNWGWTNHLTWNHPAWSISTEMAASLMFPFLVWLAPWRRVPLSALLALGAALCWGLHLHFAQQGLVSLDYRIPKTGMLRCLVSFTLGMILCVIWQRYQSHRWAPLIAAACAAIGLAAGLLSGLAETAFVPFTFAAGLMVLALDTGWLSRIFSARWLVYLGEISYATYLSHALLLRLFKLLIVGRDGQIGPLAMLAYLIIVLLASVALYHWVERPAQRWLNRRQPGRRSGIHT